MMFCLRTIAGLWCITALAASGGGDGAAATRPESFGPAVRPPVVLDARPAHPAQPAGAKPTLAASTTDDEKEILIVQALEQPTSLRITDAPLGEAIQLLSDKTGVPIEFDRFVLECLPYGSRTLVTATIENRPLKESLAALLKPLASKFVLAGDKLVIQPRPALFRIGRRATWDEVGLIEKLYSTPWSRELADSLEFQFQDMSASDAQANRRKIYDLAASVGAGHAARVLEYACTQYGWQWYPENKTITFCTTVRQIERQLERKISAQWSETQLTNVLLDLAGRAGVDLKMEPGVLASLPTHLSERFRMEVENHTVRQALELVAGATGLGYIIEPDGVRITASTLEPPSSTAASTADAAALAAAMRNTNPIVGQITFPGEDGISISIFLRQQDLPPDVFQMLQQQVRAAGHTMRNSLSTRPID